MQRARTGSEAPPVVGRGKQVEAAVRSAGSVHATDSSGLVGAQQRGPGRPFPLSRFSAARRRGRRLVATT